MMFLKMMAQWQLAQLELISFFLKKWHNRGLLKKPTFVSINEFLCELYVIIHQKGCLFYYIISYAKRTKENTIYSVS